jgi:hypothetical protein
LDLAAADLQAELDRPLPIDRDVPGFEDFAAEGVRGIEPGIPARSLLYHALASPNVTRGADGAALTDFPTLAELDAVENYVYGTKPPSLPELTALAGPGLLAVVVYATEYREAVDTPHRKHADVCFCRTGISRVGTAEARYVAQSRGFTAFVDQEVHAFRVLPARYAAYVAVQRTGDANSFGPMRFRTSANNNDADRQFWVPVHKLFDGPECIQGLTLSVALTAHHVNEKLRRIHLELNRRRQPPEYQPPEIDRPPFRFTDGIADWSADPDFGPGVLVPVVHPRLIEPAQKDGVTLTFLVPISSNSFFSSLMLSPGPAGSRPAPEYVHVRHSPDENTPNLNDTRDPAAKVQAGGYRAIHYLDFTADGWVEADVPALGPLFPRSIPAYSVVAAPDFYPNCDQRELMDWWEQKAPAGLRTFLWGQVSPETLSDNRLPPNLQLADPFAGAPVADFRPEDDTVSAVVSLPARGAVQARPLREPATRDRHSGLADAASGVFAPGWDTSVDRLGTVLHLAAYGLGSPFPEDAKLCAVLSTFWPAAAPDAGRSFSSRFATVSPMTDEELGMTPGSVPWDGVVGPQESQVNGTAAVEYASIDHVDYVESALNNLFTHRLTARVDTSKYVARVVAMARTYRGVGVTTPAGKRAWDVLSFREVAAGDAELTAAQNQAGAVLGGEVFRVELFQPAAGSISQPTDFRRSRVAVGTRRTVFIGGGRTVLVRNGNGPWEAQVVNV